MAEIFVFHSVISFTVFLLILISLSFNIDSGKEAYKLFLPLNEISLLVYIYIIVTFEL